MLISRTILLSFRTLIDLALLSPLSYACYLTRPTPYAYARVRACSLALALSLSPCSRRYRYAILRSIVCVRALTLALRSLDRSLASGLGWFGGVWFGREGGFGCVYGGLGAGLGVG